MGKKLKVTIDNLSDENYIDVAHGIVKTVKLIDPNSNISIVGGDPETFDGSSNKPIKGK